MQLLEQKLSRIDLNLLVSLSVLLKEKNVSRAAEKLYLSQSAMSRTLQRLRDLFGDPLFHRTANGITPTEKAQTIEAMLPDLLQKLESILDNEAFSPATCNKRFAISMPSLMSHAFFLPLVKDVTEEAPLIQLAEFSAKINPYKHLESGEYDFSIHVEKPNDPAFSASPLGKIYPVIFAYKDHPLAKLDQVTLEDCLAYRFLELNIEGNTEIGFVNPVDTILLKHGYRRDIQLKSSQLSILIEVLRNSNSLLTGPEFLMSSPEHKKDFVPIFEFEALTDNVIDLYLITHKRVENSAAHQWLKNKIIEKPLNIE